MQARAVWGWMVVVLVVAGGCGRVSDDIVPSNTDAATPVDSGIAPSDAGLSSDATVVVDASAPGAPAMVALCYSDLMAGDMRRTFRFYVEVKWTPNTALDLQMTPLRTAARQVSKTEIVGSAIAFGTPVLSGADRFVITSASADLPGAANPFSGSDLTFSPLSLQGRLSTGAQFCANMQAKITKPISQDFQGVCLFFRALDGEPFGFPGAGGANFVLGPRSRAITAADMVCP